MFTGLVHAVGEVIGHEAGSDGGVSIVVDQRGWEHAPGHGESISVSGVCLTVARGSEAGKPRFDVVRETLERSTLGQVQAGSRVNLEHACRADTLLGGHVVQGHVDAIGRVDRVQREGQWRVRIAVQGEPLEYLVDKGSVAVDGVSLTVAGVGVEDAGGRRGWFEVALIPTTLEETTLGGLREGDRVNLETDVLARTVVHWLRNFADARGAGGRQQG